MGSYSTAQSLLYSFSLIYIYISLYQLDFFLTLNDNYFPLSLKAILNKGKKFSFISLEIEKDISWQEKVIQLLKV